MLTRRSRAREVALQLLYQLDLNPHIERSEVARFTRERLLDPSLEPFALELYDGTRSRRVEIDKQLSAAAQNWRLSRMTVVDRNVLRLGAYELLFTPETPPKVVFDEVIELAKRFGSVDSPSFVNGVLDRLRQNANLPIPSTTPSGAAE